MSPRGWMCRNSFLVVDSWRSVGEEAIRVFAVGVQEDHYVSEISDWKYRSGKDR